MTGEEKKELLSCLRIKVDLDTKEYYTGGLDGSGNLWEKAHHLNLRLIADIEGEEIELSSEEVTL